MPHSRGTDFICRTLAVDSLMPLSFERSGEGFESDHAGSEAIERADSEICPDYSQTIIGWRPSLFREPRPRVLADVDGLGGAIVGRVAQIDFAERVREFLDLGLD